MLGLKTAKKFQQGGNFCESFKKRKTSGTEVFQKNGKTGRKGNLPKRDQPQKIHITNNRKLLLRRNKTHHEKQKKSERNEKGGSRRKRGTRGNAFQPVWDKTEPPKSFDDLGGKKPTRRREIPGDVFGEST